MEPPCEVPQGMTLRDAVRAYERVILLQALEASGWRQHQVAFSLGLLRSTLSEKMRRFGLRRSRKGRRLVGTDTNEAGGSLLAKVSEVEGDGPGFPTVG
jgi:ParB-like chromosome segregation protein Spo0J